MADERDREPSITQLSAEDSSQKNALVTDNRPSLVELPITSSMGTGDPVPETRLQKILQVIVALLPLGLLTGVGVAWAFFGRIPIEVEGRSILIIPSANIELQSRADGKVLAIHVKSGDRVRTGQLLVTLDLPGLQEQMRTEEQKLSELTGENQAVTTAQNQRTQLKRQTLQLQRQAIPTEIESFKRQIEANLRQIESNQTQLEANRRQRQAYQQRIGQLNAINALLAPRLRSYESLVRQGAVAPLSPAVLQAVQTQQDNRNTITTLTAQTEDTLASDEKLRADSKSLTAENAGLVANIESQDANTEDLTTQDQQLNLDNLKDDILRRNAITDQERVIANLETKIATEAQVFSTHNGEMLDVAVNPSQFVTAGTRLGTIQVKHKQAETVGLLFLRPGDADRIQVGMQTEITPDIDRRERYGGIVATVTSISQETIPPQEVTKLVGNELLAEALTNNQPVVQMYVKLQRDPTTISGYKWTDGEGAPQRIPESATATARVVVEERSLVSYIVPILRQFTGIYQR